MDILKAPTVFIKKLEKDGHKATIKVKMNNQLLVIPSPIEGGNASYEIGHTMEFSVKDCEPLSVVAAIFDIPRHLAHFENQFEISIVPRFRKALIPDDYTTILKGMGLEPCL